MLIEGQGGAKVALGSNEAQTRGAATAASWGDEPGLTLQAKLHDQPTPSISRTTATIRSAAWPSPYGFTAAAMAR